MSSTIYQQVRRAMGSAAMAVIVTVAGGSGTSAHAGDLLAIPQIVVQASTVASTSAVGWHRHGWYGYHGYGYGYARFRPALYARHYGPVRAWNYGAYYRPYVYHRYVTATPYYAPTYAAYRPAYYRPAPIGGVWGVGLPGYHPYYTAPVGYSRYGYYSYPSYRVFGYPYSYRGYYGGPYPGGVYGGFGSPIGYYGGNIYGGGIYGGAVPAATMAAGFRSATFPLVRSPVGSSRWVRIRFSGNMASQ